MQGPSLYMMVIVTSDGDDDDDDHNGETLSVLQVQITHGASSCIDADTRDV